MTSNHTSAASPPSVLRISVCTDYPFLLTPQQYVEYKKVWKVQYQVFPLFHYPDDDISRPPTAYSDRLLTNGDWVQTFVGKIFDPFQESSSSQRITPMQEYENTLMEQLSWSSHLGLKTVMIPYVFVEKMSVSNLIRCVMHHLQRTAYIQTILISLPVILSQSSHSSAPATDDTWFIWHQMQKLSNFNPQIALHLILPESSVECLLPTHVQRWISEPIRFISLETASFEPNNAGYPVLPRVWQSIVKTFLSYGVGVVLQGEAQIVIPNAASKNSQYQMLVDSSEDNDYDDTGMGNTDLVSSEEKLAQDRLASLDYYVQYIRYLQGNVDQHLDHVARYSYSYWDTLQTPLQPLMDHLESQTYEVFEQDPIKYRSYQQAIGLALQDLAKKLFSNSPSTNAPNPPGISAPPGLKSNPPKAAPDADTPKRQRTSATATDSTTTTATEKEKEKPRKLIVMVVGAGRGPLVSAALSAASDVQIPIFVYCVEKNPNAIITLRHRFQQERWQGQVEIVATDMRYWINPPAVADIIVSELLGSFGDNELSPECLDAAIAKCLHPTHGISIPQRYTSYLRPIAAPLHWMVARDMGRQNTGGTSGHFQHQFNASSSSSSSSHTNSGLETPYVVYLRRYLPLVNTPQPTWDFIHPAPMTTKNSNKRYAQLTFTMERTGCIYGFAGYFDTVLYHSTTSPEKKVMLSIVPATHSEGMFSWFPIFFPLNQPMDVQQGEVVTVNMWRCVDDHRVWYEWCVVSPNMSTIHNVQGRSSCVGL